MVCRNAGNLFTACHRHTDRLNWQKSVMSRVRVSAPGTGNPLGSIERQTEVI